MTLSSASRSVTLGVHPGASVATFGFRRITLPTIALRTFGSLQRQHNETNEFYN